MLQDPTVRDLDLIEHAAEDIEALLTALDARDEAREMKGAVLFNGVEVVEAAVRKLLQDTSADYEDPPKTMEVSIATLRGILADLENLCQRVEELDE